MRNGLRGCSPLWVVPMRLLFEGEWFEGVASPGQYERDFESIVSHVGSSLFVGYHTLPFRIAVESEHERRVPDMALVEVNYREWWIVEVEMAHHGLYSHVLPQVEVFANGAYTEEHVAHMVKHCDALHEGYLRDMVKASQPGVLVVVNKGVPAWREPVERAGGKLGIVEVFRSERNRHVLRVDGYWPMVDASDVITSGQLDAVLPTLLRIGSPVGLGVPAGGRLSIRFRGGLTDWMRVDSGRDVWLSPAGRNPLLVGRVYEIVAESDGGFAFREK